MFIKEAFPALLFSLCLVTNNIRSLYASLGNSEQASDSGFSNPSKISGSSDDSNISSKSSSRLIADISDVKLLCELLMLLYCQMTYFVLHSHLPPKVIQLVHSK